MTLRKAEKQCYEIAYLAATDTRTIRKVKSKISNCMIERTISACYFCHGTGCTGARVKGNIELCPVCIGRGY